MTLSALNNNKESLSAELPACYYKWKKLDDDESYDQAHLSKRREAEIVSVGFGSHVSCLDIHPTVFNPEFVCPLLSLNSERWQTPQIEEMGPTSSTMSSFVSSQPNETPHELQFDENVQRRLGHKFRQQQPSSSVRVSISPEYQTAPKFFKGAVYYGNRRSSRSDESIDLNKMSYVEIYELFKKRLTMTEEQLRRNGYPTFESPNRIIVAATKYDQGTMGWLKATDLNRKCARCRMEFVVDDDGSYPDESCSYKIGEVLKTSSTHVSTQHMDDEIHQYITAPPPTGDNDTKSKMIYAIDCEMVYTTQGFSLGRFSMVDFNGDPVLDIFVKPDAQIVDLNTAYSGLTPEMMEKTTDTLETCREKLFELINSETILVGHGLENDLKTLRLVHRKIVDTSVLFREKEKKPALRNLSAKYLKKRIQQDAPDQQKKGHCSIEDSLACMDLVKLKLKNY